MAERQTFLDMNRLALALLREHGVAEPPVNIYRIIEERKIELFFWPLTPKLSGFYEHCPITGKSITINLRDDQRKQRFTAGHELKHAICEPDKDHAALEQGKLRQVERMANAFSARLLLPEAMVRRVMRSMRAEVCVGLLADVFGVHTNVAVFRLHNLGMIGSGERDRILADPALDHERYTRFRQDGLPGPSSGFTAVDRLLTGPARGSGRTCPHCTSPWVEARAAVCWACGRHPV